MATLEDTNKATIKIVVFSAVIEVLILVTNSDNIKSLYVCSLAATPYSPNSLSGSNRYKKVCY
jgi:hypothetical protein